MKEPAKKIKIIGITGGIGSGKSVVSRIVRLNDFFVYDCDFEAKNIMIHDPNVVADLKKLLGPECYTLEGTLNRKYISEKIFSDDSLRLKVNSIVHSAVVSDFLNKIKSDKDDINHESNFNPVFIESAVLFSSGINKFCDEIWFVTAPEEIRLKRVFLRDKSTEDKIKDRIRAQENEFKHGSRNNWFVIQNYGSNEILPKVISNLNKNNKQIIKIC